MEHIFQTQGYKKLIHIAFLSLFIQFLTLSLFGQTELSYIVTEETFYEIKNNGILKEVSTQDAIEMRHKREVYRITKKTDAHSFKTIKEIIEPDPDAPKWLPDIKKIVTDNYGTKMYDSSGDLIYDKPHGKKALIDIEKRVRTMGNELKLRDYPSIESMDLKSLLKGIEVKKDIYGNLHIKTPKGKYINGDFIDFGDTEEIEIDFKNGIIKTKVKNKDKTIIEDKIEKIFKTKDGKALTQWVKHGKIHHVYNGVNRVNVKSMKEYKINGNNLMDEKAHNERGSIIQNELDKEVLVSTDDIKLFPSPAISHLSVSYPNNIYINGFNILDILGNKISTENLTLEWHDGHIKFNISNLTKGVYLFELTHSTGVVSKKFIKQ